MLIKLHFILSAVLKTCGFKIIWSQHLVKQLWPPDGCRRTEGVCQHFLQRKVIAFYNSTRKKFEIDWFKRMMMKRGKVDKQGESMVASYRYLEVFNMSLQMIGSKWVCCFLSKAPLAPRPHSSLSEEFLHSTTLRPKKTWGSWNLVNTLLRIN